MPPVADSVCPVALCAASNKAARAKGAVPDTRSNPPLRHALVEQAELPGPHDRLDAGADAQESVGLFQVLFDRALGNSENLAGIARALSRFSPAQALELTMT